VIRTSDNRVRVGRLTTATSTAPTWVTLPALPGGAIPSNANVALSGASHAVNFSTRTQVSVISSTLRLHTTKTTSDAGTVWDAWSPATVPGRSTTTGPEQVVAALGPTMATPSLDGARMFFVGGSAVGAAWATTLQEHRASDSRIWSDHVRFSWGDAGIETTTTGATESSIASGPVLQVAVAIERNNPPPWNILIADSYDNGSSFGVPLRVFPADDLIGPRPSASDPLATHGGFGGHMLHYADIEMERETGDACPHLLGSYKLTYRRGLTANEIAVGLTKVVDTGDIDHPGLGVTVSTADEPTAHIAYWRTIDETMEYWTLAPGDVASGPHTIPDLNIPRGTGFAAAPAGISVGNFQSQVWGWTFDPDGGFPWICRMNGSQGTNLTCGRPEAAITPIPAGKQISFGPALSAADQAKYLCTLFDSGASTREYRCFQTWQPASVVADPSRADRLHIVYQAFVPGTNRTAIYYTRNTDSSLSVWTTPVQIAVDATRDLIDPELTVDFRGHMVVTYSRIAIASFATPTNGSADVLVAWSRVGDPSWVVNNQVVSTWDAENLPFHCKRKKDFLGEYRYGEVVANRAQHLVPASTGAASAKLQQRVLWFSSAYNLD
jgi:hypothetical protein